MKQLTLNNIEFVKENYINETCSGFVVGMVGGSVSDLRLFTSYKFNELPKTVQTFISSHNKELFSEDTWQGIEYKTYIYRR